MEPELKDHIIICGLNATSISIIDTLDGFLTRHSDSFQLPSGQIPHQYLLIDSEADAVEKISDRYNHFHFIIGDATEDDILEQANIKDAYGIFPVLEQNKDNLFITFTARKLNSDIRIVARTTDIHRIEEKLINAGADSVVSPNFIGGMRIVSEMVRPHSVAFLDQLLRQKNTDLSLEELRLTESCLLCGTPISESKIYRKTGLRVIALRKKTSLMYIYNPTGKTILEAGDIIVVLGQNEQILALKKLTSE